MNTFFELVPDAAKFQPQMVAAIERGEIQRTGNIIADMKRVYQHVRSKSQGNRRARRSMESEMEETWGGQLAMTMFDLGNYARLQKPYAARRLALERCIERETNATKLACLEHALTRVTQHQKLLSALTEELMSENEIQIAEASAGAPETDYTAEMSEV